TMADHAVERVGGLVDENPWQAEKGVPEGRRHDAIAEILGQRFDGGADDAVLVEAFGIAADDVRYRLAAAKESLIGERRADGDDMIEEAPLRQQHGDDQRL